VGALDWILAFGNRLGESPEGTVRLIDEGLKHLEIALALSPDYIDAMTYKNLLLRQKAQLMSDANEQRRLIAEADQWFNKALETRRKNRTPGPSAPIPGQPLTDDLAPPPPPPPPPPPR